MTKEEALLWLIALDYAATEAWDTEEHDFISEWWTSWRDGCLWSLSCFSGMQRS